MEDDDEFGDLYTDVLRPFSSSLSSAPQPQQPSPAPSSTHRPIDLNLHSNLNNDDINDDILRRNLPLTKFSSVHNSIPIDNNSAGGPRVFSSPDLKLSISSSHTADFSDFQSGKEDKDITFDIEEGNTGIIEDSGPIIPGLTVDVEDSKTNEASGGGEVVEDWEVDSDSEDDLQIVLNDTNHGPMGMERGMLGDTGVGDDDDDDEDGNPLVIISDGGSAQPVEEQNWGVVEDGGAVARAEGERKEGEAAGKGSAVAGPKIGYSNHGYHHPFHSQFKVSGAVVVIC